MTQQKGIFPYTYIENYTKLNEDKLPEKEQFYNDVTDEHSSEDEYKRALNVWNVFDCQSRGEYLEIYLKLHVLLLADSFKNFGKTYLNSYKLDPTHYYTFSGLRFVACLKYTEVE